MNLAAGCAALRCEVRTASGRASGALRGGQPGVRKAAKQVEHARRLTMVSGSQSLQFRLPPPGVAVPAPRSSPAIAGGTPVVDALVLTSVWAVHVLRGICLDAKSFGLISMGIAAVGASATAGVAPNDAQRLKMMVSGVGPTSALPAAGAADGGIEVEEGKAAEKAEDAVEAINGVEAVEEGDGGATAMDAE